MHALLDPYANLLHATAVSALLRSQENWLWPTCETLHFFGLALLIGTAGFFDLRLLGLARRVPMSVAREFMPVGIFGFSLNVVTGVLFFVAEPGQYMASLTWWAKVASLVVSGLNAAILEKTQRARLLALRNGEDTPLSFKIFGGVSLVAWCAVLFFGRMIPYLDPQ